MKDFLFLSIGLFCAGFIFTIFAVAFGIADGSDMLTNFYRNIIIAIL